jgi:hypothetical protein
MQVLPLLTGKYKRNSNVIPGFYSPIWGKYVMMIFSQEGSREINTHIKLLVRIQIANIFLERNIGSYIKI